MNDPTCAISALAREAVSQLPRLDADACETVVHMLMELPHIVERSERRAWLEGVLEFIEDERVTGAFIQPSPPFTRLDTNDRTALRTVVHDHGFRLPAWLAPS